MKHQIATTPEQSRRLIACGVNPDSADMFYTNYTTKLNDKMPIVKTAPLEIRKDLIPAWSLSALLALFPMEVNEDGLHTVFHLIYYPDELKWAAEYYDYTMDKNLCSKRDYNPIEACVQVIEYLTANSFTLNTK